MNESVRIDAIQEGAPDRWIGYIPFDQLDVRVERLRTPALRMYLWVQHIEGEHPFESLAQPRVYCAADDPAPPVTTQVPVLPFFVNSDFIKYPQFRDSMPAPDRPALAVAAWIARGDRRCGSTRKVKLPHYSFRRRRPRHRSTNQKRAVSEARVSIHSFTWFSAPKIRWRNCASSRLA